MLIVSINVTSDHEITRANILSLWLQPKGRNLIFTLFRHWSLMITRVKKIVRLIMSTVNSSKGLTAILIRNIFGFGGYDLRTTGLKIL